MIKFFKYLIIMLYAIAQSADHSFVEYNSSFNSRKEGDFRYTAFSKSEYFLNENLSLKAHPIAFFMFPALELKNKFWEDDKIIISSFHNISYPTLFYKIVQNEGTGGFISPEFEIPNMFILKNGITAAYNVSENQFLQASLSIEFAINNKLLEAGTSIDLPFFLDRTMVLYKDLGFNLSLSAEGKLISDFDYYVANRLYLFPIKNDKYDYEYQNTSNNIFNELYALGFYNFGNNLKIGIGGVLCYGTYPFGNKWHLLPFIDFVKVIKK